MSRKKKIALVIGAGSVKCAAAPRLFPSFPISSGRSGFSTLTKSPMRSSRAKKVMNEQLGYIRRLLEMDQP